MLCLQRKVRCNVQFTSVIFNNVTVKQPVSPLCADKAKNSEGHWNLAKNWEISSLKAFCGSILNATLKLFASLDMPVFVSQVLMSFVTQRWGIPKLKIVPASDYAPHLLHTFPSPRPVQLYTYQKLQ